MGVIKSNQPEERPKLPRQQTVREDKSNQEENDLED